MRKLLLASAAVLGAASWLNPAAAQPTAMPMMPTQGMMAATPSASPPAGANNNNNTAVTPAPGAVATPTPGTVVIHVNGRVTTELNGAWSSLDKVGGFKVQPTNISNFARIYTGLDAMAANGMRYGGAIEIRENFTGQTSSAASTGASGYSSSETLFVRRAFGYVAADNVGILRFGQGDGLISLYDNGVTTFQFDAGGNLNGGDLQSVTIGNTQIPFVYMAVAGNEYSNNKLVYMTPQFYGFDFGFQWAPNTSNGNASCSVPGSGCAGLSSSTVPVDGSRVLNQTNVGVRYQGKFSGLGVLAYGVYAFSGHADYNGPSIAFASAAQRASSGGTGKFDNLSAGYMGAALTYAGFTVGGNYVVGAVNGQGALRPSGGAGTNAWLAGVTYKTGPLTVGAVYESIDSQGAVQLAGISQRHEYAVNVGANYVIAPGLVAYAEYLYQNRKQSGFNFATGSASVGTGAYNSVQAQGLEIGTTIYW